MDLVSAEIWQNLFENWPDAIDKKAAIVTKTGDLIPFRDFMVANGLLLLDRDNPDASGMRKVIIGYEAVAMVKFPLTCALSRFQCMGFHAEV